MKTKKVLIVITSIILIGIPINTFAWLTHNSTYLAPNKINLFISIILKTIAFVITLSYLTIAIRYMRYSEDKVTKKAKNIFIWLIITIIQVVILLFSSTWVKEIGMEKYLYPSHERYQSSLIKGYISSAFRIVSVTSIIVYIVRAIDYYIKSEEEAIKKVKKLVKWEMITGILVVMLLICAKN